MTPATSKRGSSIVGAELNEAPISRRPKRREINPDGPSKQTLVVPRPSHTRLVDYAKEQKVSLQDIFVQAMDEWLLKRGMPAMYDAEGREQ